MFNWSGCTIYTVYSRVVCKFTHSTQCTLGVLVYAVYSRVYQGVHLQSIICSGVLYRVFRRVKQLIVRAISKYSKSIIRSKNGPHHDVLCANDLGGCRGDIHQPKIPPSEKKENRP